MKIEECNLSQDESYDSCTKSELLKRKRGRPKKLLPTQKKKCLKVEFERTGCPHCEKAYNSKVNDYKDKLLQGNHKNLISAKSYNFYIFFF